MAIKIRLQEGTGAVELVDLADPTELDAATTRRFVETLFDLAGDELAALVYNNNNSTRGGWYATTGHGNQTLTVQPNGTHVLFGLSGTTAITSLAGYTTRVFKNFVELDQVAIGAASNDTDFEIAPASLGDNVTVEFGAAPAATDRIDIFLTDTENQVPMWGSVAWQQAIELAAFSPDDSDTLPVINRAGGIVQMEKNGDTEVIVRGGNNINIAPSTGQLNVLIHPGDGLINRSIGSVFHLGIDSDVITRRDYIDPLVTGLQDSDVRIFISINALDAAVTELQDSDVRIFTRLAALEAREDSDTKVAFTYDHNGDPNEYVGEFRWDSEDNEYVRIRTTDWREGFVNTGSNLYTGSGHALTDGNSDRLRVSNLSTSPAATSYYRLQFVNNTVNYNAIFLGSNIQVSGSEWTFVRTSATEIITWLPGSFGGSTGVSANELQIHLQNVTNISGHEVTVPTTHYVDEQVSNVSIVLFDSDNDGTVRHPTSSEYQSGYDYYLGADNVWRHVSHSPDTDYSPVRPRVDIYDTVYDRNHADTTQARGDIAIVRGVVERGYITGRDGSNNVDVQLTNQTNRTYLVRNINQDIINEYLQPGLTFREAANTGAIITIVSIDNDYVADSDSIVIVGNVADAEFNIIQNMAVETEKLNEDRGTYIFDSDYHAGNTTDSMWTLELANHASTARFGRFYNGLVPSPGLVLYNDSDYYLAADGTWQLVTNKVADFQEQSDWDDTDTTSIRYIRNKPQIRRNVNVTDVESVSGLRVRPGGTDGLHIHRVTQQGTTRIQYDVDSDDYQQRFVAAEFDFTDAQDPTNHFVRINDTTGLTIVGHNLGVQDVGVNGTYRLIFDSDGVQHFLTNGEGIAINGNQITSSRSDWDVTRADSDRFIRNKPPITNELSNVTQIQMDQHHSVRFGASNQNNLLFHETGNSITGFVNEIRSANDTDSRDLNIRGGPDVSLESYYAHTNTRASILRLENNAIFIGTSADQLQSLFLSNGTQTFLTAGELISVSGNVIGVDSEIYNQVNTRIFDYLRFDTDIINPTGIEDIFITWNDTDSEWQAKHVQRFKGDPFDTRVANPAVFVGPIAAISFLHDTDSDLLSPTGVATFSNTYSDTDIAAGSTVAWSIPWGTFDTEVWEVVDSDSDGLNYGINGDNSAERNVILRNKTNNTAHVNLDNIPVRMRLDASDGIPKSLAYDTDGRPQPRSALLLDVIGSADDIYAIQFDSDDDLPGFRLNQHPDGNYYLYQGNDPNSITATYVCPGNAQQVVLTQIVAQATNAGQISGPQVGSSINNYALSINSTTVEGVSVLTAFDSDSNFFMYDSETGYTEVNLTANVIVARVTKYSDTDIWFVSGERGTATYTDSTHRTDVDTGVINKTLEVDGDKRVPVGPGEGLALISQVTNNETFVVDKYVMDVEINGFNSNDTTFEVARVGITDDEYLDIHTKTFGNPEKGDYIGHNGDNWVKVRPFNERLPVGTNANTAIQDDITGLTFTPTSVVSPNTFSVAGQGAFGTHMPMSISGTNVSDGFRVVTVDTQAWGLSSITLNTLPKAPALTNVTALKNDSDYARTVYADDFRVRLVSVYPAGSATLNLKLILAVYTDSDGDWVFTNNNLNSDVASATVTNLGAAIDTALEGGIRVGAGDILVPLLIAEWNDTATRSIHYGMVIQESTFRFSPQQEVEFDWGLNNSGTALQINGVDVTGTAQTVQVAHVDVEENTTDLGEAETLNFTAGLLASGTGTEKNVGLSINVQNSSGTGIAADSDNIHTIKPEGSIQFGVGSNTLTVSTTADSELAAQRIEDARLQTEINENRNNEVKVLRAQFYDHTHYASEYLASITYGDSEVIWTFDSDQGISYFNEGLTNGYQYPSFLDFYGQTGTLEFDFISLDDWKLISVINVVDQASSFVIDNSARTVTVRGTQVQVRDITRNEKGQQVYSAATVVSTSIVEDSEILTNAVVFRANGDPVGSARDSILSTSSNGSTGFRRFSYQHEDYPADYDYARFDSDNNVSFTNLHGLLDSDIRPSDLHAVRPMGAPPQIPVGVGGDRFAWADANGIFVREAYHSLVDSEIPGPGEFIFGTGTPQAFVPLGADSDISTATTIRISKTDGAGNDRSAGWNNTSSGISSLNSRHRFVHTFGSRELWFSRNTYHNVATQSYITLGIDSDDATSYQALGTIIADAGWIWTYTPEGDPIVQGQAVYPGNNTRRGTVRIPSTSDIYVNGDGDIDWTQARKDQISRMDTEIQRIAPFTGFYAYDGLLSLHPGFTSNGDFDMQNSVGNPIGVDTDYVDVRTLRFRKFAYPTQAILQQSVDASGNPLLATLDLSNKFAGVEAFGHIRGTGVIGADSGDVVTWQITAVRDSDDFYEFTVDHLSVETHGNVHNGASGWRFDFIPEADIIVHSDNVHGLTAKIDSDIIASPLFSRVVCIGEGRFVTVKSNTTGLPILSVDDLTTDSETFYSGKARTDGLAADGTCVHMIQRTRVVTDTDGNVTTPTDWHTWNGTQVVRDVTTVARRPVANSYIQLSGTYADYTPGETYQTQVSITIPGEGTSVGLYTWDYADIDESTLRVAATGNHAFTFTLLSGQANHLVVWDADQHIDVIDTASNRLIYMNSLTNWTTNMPNA